MLKTMRPRYTASKISAIRYLYGYISLLFGHKWAPQNVRVILVSAVYQSAV